MHRVSGTILLTVAACCSVCSNVLLIFLSQESSYFTFIFPSLMLSTVGMDWTMNVGSVGETSQFTTFSKTDLRQLYTLSALPLIHQSIGASLLQTTMRLGLPLGLGITTAIWSSFDGKTDDAMLPFSRIFMTTTAFAGLSLVAALFIRIGRQGHTLRRVNKDEKLGKDETADNRPSKRWSYVETITSNSNITSPKPELPPIRTTSLSSEFSMIQKNRNSSRDTTNSQTTKPKIVWVVCEQCNASRRVTEPIGDPAKYFDDLCGTLEKPNHDMIVNGRRRFPLVARNINMNR